MDSLLGEIRSRLDVFEDSIAHSMGEVAPPEYYDVSENFFSGTEDQKCLRGDNALF